MATAYAQVSGSGVSYPLKGSTPDPDSAPITWSFRNVTFSEAELLSARPIKQGKDVVGVQIGPTQFFNSPEVVATIISGMPAAVSSVKSISAR